MPTDGKQLGQVLIEMGIVDERKVNEALEYQKRAKPGTKIGQAMIELGFCDETQVTKGLCRQYRLPVRGPLAAPRSRPRSPTSSRRRSSHDFNVVPVKMQEGKLILAADDPMVTFVADDLRFALNREIDLRADARRRALAQRARRGLRARRAGRGARGQAAASPARRRRTARGAGHPARAGHHGEGAHGARVRHPRRADGRARPRALPRGRRLLRGARASTPSSPGPVITRCKVMAKMDIAEKRMPQDGRIKTAALRPPDRPARLARARRPRRERRHAYPRPRGGPRRPRPAWASSASDRERFEQIIQRPNGIFLVTGPTGSGKTTTLYAALKTLNKPDVKIITAEDPVEYNLAGINQCEVQAPHRARLPAHPARHAAPGAQHHPGRRNPRQGDGRDRDPGRR